MIITIYKTAELSM